MADRKFTFAGASVLIDLQLKKILTQFDWIKNEVLNRKTDKSDEFVASNFV